MINKENIIEIITLWVNILPKLSVFIKKNNKHILSWVLFFVSMSLSTYYYNNNILNIGQLLVINFIVYLLLMKQQKLVENVFEKNSIEQTNEHRHNMAERRNVNNEVNSILNSLLINTKSDSVFIGEYHNGTLNSGGLSFIYLTLTYEQLNKRVKPISKEFQKTPLTNLPLMDLLYNKKILMLDIDEVEEIDKRFHFNLTQYDVKYVCLIELSSFINGYDEELGFIGLVYLNSSNVINEDEIKQELITKGQNISQLLSYKIKK